MPWVNKYRYEQLIQSETKFDAEKRNLKDLTAECENQLKNPQLRFIHLRPLEPDEKETYIENIASLFDNRFFQIFIHNVREKFIRGLSQNPVAVGGSIDAIDAILNEIYENKREYLNLAIEAENEPEK